MRLASTTLPSLIFCIVFFLLLSVPPWGCGDDPSRPKPEEQCATPSFEPGPGDFTEPVDVSIQSATPGSVIRYTLDGTAPGENAAVYSFPVAIETTTTLKARATKVGFLDSEVASGTYRINPCAATVVLPNGGEKWELGTSAQIRWTTEGCVGPVRIELIHDGSPCLLIAQETENDGAFDWIPMRCGGFEEGYRVRVTLPQAGAGDESDAPFRLVESCELEVLAPNGDETWTEGETRTISWSGSAGCGDTVRVELLLEGAACAVLAESAPPTGSLEWIVAPCEGAVDGYRVRVVDSGTGESDSSDGTFAIAPAECGIRLLSQNAGGVLIQGDAATILWSSESCGASVRIELVLAGTVCMSIADETENDGSHPWTIARCGAAVGSYRIRITDRDSGAADESDLPFSIETEAIPCVIAVDSPSAGAVWQEGSTQEILWSAEACGDSARIELLLQDESCRTLFERTANDGQEPWVVARCGEAAGGYSIRIVDLRSGDASDGGMFTISTLPPPPCEIEVVRPAPGTTWRAGETAAIAWTASACGSAVRIDLLCNGIVCDEIAASAPNGGSFDWVAAPCCASVCGYAIRVTDLSTGAADMSDGDLCIPDCRLQVDSPAEDDSWVEGGEQTIVWRSEECGAWVGIDLLHEGMPCAAIAAAAPNTGSFVWTAARCAGQAGAYGILIVDLETGREALSGAFQIPAPERCAIGVTAPAGGASWPVGTVHDIEWTSTDCGETVRIDLLRDGATCAEIAAATPNSGSFQWTVEGCDSATDGYRIRIADLASGAADTTEAPFWIPAPPPCVISVLSPNGGEEWQLESQQTILWQESACDDSVRILLVSSGDLPCREIAVSTEDDGSYAWIVGDCSGGEGGGYRVRVIGLQSGVEAESDRNFEVTLPCSLTVVAPAGGEAWNEGTAQTIQWASSGHCGDAVVSIDLLRGGSICRAIAASTLNDGTFEWTPAGCSGSEEGYSIRVRGIDSGVEGVSGIFSIPRCAIEIVSPSTGDTIQAGAETPVAWISSGPCGGGVRIELICGEDVCSTLSADTPNDGSFPWIATACCDALCSHSIRVTDPATGISAAGGLFCVCPPCTIGVASPAGGESWIEGSEQSIEWTSEDCGETVRIELLRQGEPCLTLAEAAPNTGSFSWVVENCGGAADGYAVRVSGGCGVRGESGGEFSIPECILALTAPNGNETIAPGSARTITWTSFGPCGSDLRIDLVKDGAVCANISPATENDGSFEWTAQPCGGNGCGYKIRISDPATGRLDESNASFCICPDCPQEVTSPNGGEVWEDGTAQQITWDADAVCDASVRIDLLQGGFACRTIAASTPNDGSFDWIVDRCDDTGGYKIRVTGLTCGRSDESDGGFSIPLPPCIVTVTSPNGGEFWDSGTSRTIVWSTGETCGGSVRIELLRDGAPCRQITASTANDGSYSWVVEPCDGLEEGYAIRVVDLSSGNSDESDAVFTIPICGLELTRPAGGEIWQEGTTEPILWNSTDPCGDHVRLDLVRNGAVCRTITYRTPNDGHYDWLVQNCGTSVDGYMLRVTDTSTGSSDESGGAIEISEPPCRIEVVSPAGGEVWNEGDGYEIRWNSYDDCGSSVKIELVRDGEVCALIHPGTPNDGSFLWTALACEPTGTGYTVRVTDLASGAPGESPSPFSIATAADLYAIESGVLACRGESDVEIAVRARNSGAVGGYGVRICFDPAVFECLNTTLEGTRGETHDYYDGGCEGSCARAGVIVGPDCESALPAGDGAVLKLLLRVKADAPLGPTTLAFENQDPSYNTMAPCGGGSVDPLLVPGTVEICGGPGR